MITSPTNRIYVGSTNDVEYRIRQYKGMYDCHQRKLYNSLKKYGWENHIFEIIWAGELCEMLKYEYLLGHHLDVLSTHTGMNCKLPIWGEKPICYSEDTLKRMSDIRLGDKNPMFGLKGELNPNYKRKCTKESRERMSKSQMGKKLSEETKLKIGLRSKGKKHTQKAKDKISENNSKYFLGKTLSENHKNNISISLKGKLRGAMSVEQKSNLSKSKLGKKQTKEHKLKSANAANKSVLQYDLDMNFIREWNSISNACKELLIKSLSGIVAVCKGKRKLAGGFKWKYKK